MIIKIKDSKVIDTLWRAEPFINLWLSKNGKDMSHIFSEMKLKMGEHGEVMINLDDTAILNLVKCGVLDKSTKPDQGAPEEPQEEEFEEEKPEKAHRHMTKEEAREFIRTYGRVGKYGVVAVHMYRYSCATFLVSFDDQDNIENFYDGYRPDNLDWKFSEFSQEELDAVKDPDTKKWIYFRSDSMSDARDRYLYHKDWTYRTHFGPLDYQPLIEARHWRDPEYPIATKK